MKHCFLLTRPGLFDPVRRLGFLAIKYERLDRTQPISNFKGGLRRSIVRLKGPASRLRLRIWRDKERDELPGAIGVRGSNQDGVLCLICRIAEWAAVHAYDYLDLNYPTLPYNAGRGI